MLRYFFVNCEFANHMILYVKVFFINCEFVNHRFYPFMLILSGQCFFNIFKILRPALECIFCCSMTSVGDTSPGYFINLKSL